MDLTSEGSPDTGKGVLNVSFEPSPGYFPQQYAAPETVTAHDVKGPTAIDEIFSLS